MGLDSMEAQEGFAATQVPSPAEAAQTGNVYVNAGAPTNGTSGTYAGVAVPGSLLVNISASPPAVYANTNTLLSPTWALIA